MCFNRRRNIFTLGDFHHTTNPVVARVRAQTKSRLQSDLFERDPFKVQSYNFYYAERPAIQPFSNHLHCNCISSTSKPFDTYYYNHGFSNTRHDENSAQASKSLSFRGRKCSETQISKNNSTNVLCKQTSRCFNSNNSNCQQIGTQRQQWEYSNATSANKSNCTNQQKLSAYLEGRQAARNNKSTNTSTTSLSSPQYQTRCSNSRERIPKWVCRNEERILQTDATERAKQAARGTSKAMAAAVGTVGKGAVNNTTGNGNMEATTAATARRNSSGPLFSSSVPFNSVRCDVSSWRSSPTTETISNKFNTRASCSSTALEKKTANGTSQTNAYQQNGQKIGGGGQQWRQPQQQRISSTLGHVVNRNIKNPQQTKTVTPRCNSCQISIALKSLLPKQTKPENIIIKIESASPFKVVSNGGNGSNTCTSNAAKIRSKRLNNLMARKTTTNAQTHSPNITSKVSSGTVEMNKCQLKDFNSEDDSLNQRRLNCERFFEREDERLRQRAATFVPCGTKSNEIGHVLGSSSASKERLPKLVPCVSSSIVKPIVRSSSSNTSRNVDNSKISAVTDNSGGSTSKRLESIYNRELTDLRQLRASIDAISCSSKKSCDSIRSVSKPLNRTSPPVQRRLIAGSEPDHLSRISSNSTFTLPRRSSFTQACRSVSQSSVRSVSSYQSEASNSTFLS